MVSISYSSQEVIARQTDLPIGGKLRQAEGDGGGGDEEAVKDGQHHQHLPECHLKR